MNNLHKILSKALEKTLATKRFIQINYRKNGKYGQIAGFATIDSEDYDRLNQYNWSFNSGGYLQAQIGRKKLRMHRLIMNNTFGFDIDHIDGIKTDNRKSNLRICTNAQNQRNSKKQKDCSSDFKGVSWHVGVKNSIHHAAILS